MYGDHGEPEVMLVKRLLGVLVACLMVSLMTLPGWAQEFGEPERERLIEEERRAELEPTALPEQRLLLEYGGWYRSTYAWFDDIGNEVVMMHQDLRLWASGNLDDVLFGYGRIRLGYVDYGEGDDQRGRNHDGKGPNLDMGFLSLDVNKALEKYSEGALPWDVRVQGGRQYYHLGRGLVMRDVQDGVQLFVRSKYLDFRGLGSWTIRSRDNVDRSVPGFTESHRLFLGGQLDYTGFDKHTPYVYFLSQDDYSEELPEDPLQEYRYDSNYLGLGSVGELFRNARYYTEVSLQRGESYATGTTTKREDVKAYALDLGLDYFFPCHTHPRLGVEWAYGSGDDDRMSVTNAVGGNQPDSIDTNYLYFGVINTGYALAPRLSNLQFIRVGGTLKPFQGSEHFDRLEVGCNFFEYRKDEASGAISDFRANRDHEDVGSALDFIVFWRIFHDLQLSAKYGVFYPGKAYSSRASREFLLTSITYSF